MRHYQTILALALTAGFAAVSHAQEAAKSVVKLPDEMKYKTPPKGNGPHTVVLYGNPTKPGVFVMRARFPAGYKITPRWRPDEWRTAVVLSGTFYYGIGERWDESKLRAYPPGTFFAHPSKHPHFAWAKDGDVVVQFTAMGPTGTTLIPPR
jgi:hypothetical protein